MISGRGVVGYGVAQDLVVARERSSMLRDECISIWLGEELVI